VAFPIRVLNNANGAGSGGSISIAATVAGNLLVVVLGGSGSVSGDVDTFTEVVPGSSPTIWYAVSVGGTTTINYSSSVPGCWFFEMTTPFAGWEFLNATTGAATLAATNQWSYNYPTANCTIQTAPAVAGDDGNCCYFTVMYGSDFYGNYPLIASASGDWRLHNHVFADNPFVTSSHMAILMNGSGIQQFQLWVHNNLTSATPQSCLAAAFGTSGPVSGGGGPPPDTDEDLPNTFLNF